MAVMTTVPRNKQMTSTAPGFKRELARSSSDAFWGAPSLTYGCIKHAGTTQLTMLGIRRRGKSASDSVPRCHTMSVVKSPKGLNAPPEFAATTMFTQHIATYSGSPLPTAETTAPIRTAVVRLSAIGDSQKATVPVTQKQLRYENPLSCNQERMRAKTLS